MTNSSPTETHALRREIERVAAEARRKALDGETPTEEINRVKALQDILVALPEKRSHQFYWAIITAAVCLIAVSLAWTVPIRETRVQLDVTTTSVSMRLADSFAWSGTWRIDPTQVRLEHFSNLDLPPEYFASDSIPREGSLDFKVPGGDVRLRDLFVGQGGLLTIERSEASATDIVVQDASAHGDIYVSGTVTGRVGPSLDANLAPKRFDPEWPPGRFGFRYDDGHGALPALLHVKFTDMLSLREISVNGLDFFAERAGGTGNPAFTSQIVSGTLTIIDTGEHVPLSAAAALQLNTHGLVSVLQVTQEGVRVKFEGWARRVELGKGDFARSLKPTIIEWLFHQRKLGFFWSAITVLWGIGWGERKLLSGKD